MTNFSINGPLMIGEARIRFRAGLLMRAAIRQSCLALGLEYAEEKGLLDSMFVIRGQEKPMRRFMAWMEEETE
jgi:hypothetical protein